MRTPMAIMASKGALEEVSLSLGGAAEEVEREVRSGVEPRRSVTAPVRPELVDVDWTWEAE